MEKYGEDIPCVYMPKAGLTTNIMQSHSKTTNVEYLKILP